MPLQLLLWEQDLIQISWLQWWQLGAVLVHLRVGRKTGAHAPDLGFRSCQLLFLLFRLSSSALKLPNPEKPAFSSILNSDLQLPASSLANGSTAHPSRHLPSCSREKGSSHITPGSSKKKRRKQHHGAEGSPCASPAEGKDEIPKPPRKKKKLSQEGSVSLMGKEVEGRGGQEAPSCEDMESRPKKHVSDPMKPVFHLKKKKKKRRVEETEKCCSGTLSLGG